MLVEVVGHPATFHLLFYEYCKFGQTTIWLTSDLDKLVILAFVSQLWPSGSTVWQSLAPILIKYTWTSESRSSGLLDDDRQVSLIMVGATLQESGPHRPELKNPGVLYNICFKGLMSETTSWFRAKVNSLTGQFEHILLFVLASHTRTVKLAEKLNSNCMLKYYSVALDLAVFKCIQN